jgi:cobalt-zinc-cadmium efflux system outer membrane protein
MRVSAANRALDALVAEAMAHSPLIAVARARWLAAGKVPSQAATLPDPQVTLQEFTVGGPKPLEGYETSDFYYTGIGAEQDIPGPGKLRLAAAAASHDADAARHQYLARQREIVARVSESYFNLFYSMKALGVLERSRADLMHIANVAEAQYRLGMARQQDVLRAQFHATELLKEIAAAREDFAAQQAALKALLGRDPDSGDIPLAEVKPSAMRLPDSALAAAATGGSEELKAAQAMEAKGAAALALAHRGYWPDFSVGYMYQKTGPGFRDYFMLTLGAKIPLYFWRKQTPAIEQAALEREAALADVRATRLEAEAQARAQWLALRTAEHTLAIYRQGLIPQAAAAEASALNDYRAGRVDFQTLLGAALEVLSARQSYWRTLADHEIAAARLRQIIGDTP